MIADASAEFQEKKRRLMIEAKRSGGVFGAAELALLDDGDDDGEEQVARFLGQNMAGAANGAGGPSAEVELKAHVVVPSQDEIGAMLIEQKKLALLGKYV